ncbi:unnamed protein product [Paramecium octaurelia]|uniref:WD40-repeat-containing domain n=1 Tax=Paramecium octaurelia TaxID=43137 RepID=A0A8S1XCU9_PAROT|nr:unnamed protein product [Paramecium octaurelia]
MSGEQINLCHEHQQEFVALENGEKEMEKIRLCLKCLANGYKRKVILIKEQIKNVQNLKSKLSQERQEQVKENLQQVAGLIEHIQKLKEFYISQIKSIDELGEIWKQKIQIMGDSFIEQVNKQEESDQEQFLYFVNQLQNTQIQELFEQKIKIEKEIFSLKEPEDLLKCDTILKAIQYDTKKIDVETKEEAQEIIKLNIFCEEHQNKRVKLFYLGTENRIQKRLACLQCFDNHPSKDYQTVDKVHSKWNKIIQKRQENMKRNLQTIQKNVEQINEDMQSMQESIKQSFDKNRQNLTQNYNQYISEVEQCSSKMNVKWQQLQKEEILNIVEELSNTQQQQISNDPLLQKYVTQEELVNEIKKNQLLYLQQCQLTEIRKLNNPLFQNLIIDEMATQFQKILPNQNGIFKTRGSSTQIQMEVQTKVKINSQNFIYNLMKESSVKEEQSCRAMAFNQDCSVVFVGCNEQIQVYEFRQERLKKIQTLSVHESSVVTVNFIKRSNQFISGSEGDGQIIIWSLNDNKEWFISQKLNKHSTGIRCLIVNDSEDIIVSCGLDDKLVFWIKKNQWISKQTIKKQGVYGLSINQQQNKLISCVQEDQIAILEFSISEKIWVTKQQIPLQQKGIRVCFIDDNQFTIQTYQNDILDFYEMKNKDEFTKTKGIKVLKGQQDECPFFPLQYIKSQSLLVSKNCQYINILNNKQNGEFILQQSIEFQSSKLYGCMSDDAQYLITWDDVSKEIQIRKYQEL